MSKFDGVDTKDIEHRRKMLALEKYEAEQELRLMQEDIDEMDAELRKRAHA